MMVLEVLECVQRWAVELGKGLEHKEESGEFCGAIEGGGGLSLQKRRLRGDFLALHSSLTGGVSRQGVLGSSPRKQGQEEGERPQVVPREI